MAINKKLIHFKKKENFNSEVANGNILDTSIVFIKDTHEIYTHGDYYTCKDWADNIDDLQTLINTLVSGNASTAIESFNEIIAFLEGIEDSNSLNSIIASIEQQIANVQSAIPTALSQLTADSTHRLVTDTEKSTWSEKQDLISDLETIRQGAAKGATALQTVPSEYITESELEAENYVASSDGTITNILKVTALPDSPDANTLYIIVEG